MSGIIGKWNSFMTESRSRLATDIGLLIARIGFGGLMLVQHGYGKLASFAERHESFPDPVGVGSTFSLILAVFAEFFCSIAVMFGLFTRLAVVPLMVTMLVAAFIIHWDDPFSRKEFALLYFIPFLSLFFTGPGRLSLDHLIAGRGK